MIDIKEIRQNSEDALDALGLMEGRNADIARRVVRGETYSSVAKDYGITGSQIRVVAIKCIHNAFRKRAAMNAPKCDDADIEVFRGNGISTRSYNVLKSFGVKTIGEMRAVAESPEEILRRPNFSWKSLVEIRKFLGIELVARDKNDKSRGIKSIYDDWMDGSITAEAAMREIGEYNGWETK